MLSSVYTRPLRLTGCAIESEGIAGSGTIIPFSLGTLQDQETRTSNDILVIESFSQLDGRLITLC